MNEQIFKAAFIILFLGYILIRAPFTKIYKQQQQIRSLTTTTERVLLSLLGVGLLGLPLLWVVTPVLDRFNLEFWAWLRIIGILIAIASLFYFYAIHKALGANWSPTLEIRKGHELIKTGPYRTIRHPMYAQIWLWTIAQALIVSNIVAGFSGILIWAILYFSRIRGEEDMMIQNFGSEYMDYVQRTGRVFPKMKRKGK